MILVLTLALVAQAPVTKVAVIPTHVDDNAKGEIPELFDDHVLTAVQSLAGLTAIGQDDINAMLGLEQQKELLGCDDVSCVAEIGGALGVDKLMVLKVARVGAKWAVTAKIMTTDPPSVEKRTSNFVEGGTEELMEAMGWIVPEVFGRGVKPAAAGSAFAQPEPTVEPEPTEPIPEDPTPFEISIALGLYPGHPNSPETPDDTAPEGTVLLQKELTAAPSFTWRYADLGSVALLLQATAGLASVHSFTMEFGSGISERSSSSGGESYLWLEVLQLLRVPFYENNERYLLMPSDRVGLEVGVGGHAVIGVANEAGLSARVALYGAWFMLGAQLAVGSTTNVQFGPVFGLRFGF